MVIHSQKNVERKRKSKTDCEDYQKLEFIAQSSSRFWPCIILLGIVAAFGVIFIILWKAIFVQKQDAWKETSFPIHCSSKPPLTYIQRVTTEGYGPVLHINVSALQWYVDENKSVSCCYSSVSYMWHLNRNEMQDDFNVTKCASFIQEVELQRDEEFILVKCKAITGGTENKTTDKLVYINMHAVVTVKLKVQQKLNLKKQSKGSPPFSVILIAYDPLTKLNFLRMFPKTADFLQRNGFISLEKYHTIVNNATTNAMAVLTGFNTSKATEKCFPNTQQMDFCPFIWKQFSDGGFITAFIEDGPHIKTNGYERDAFVHPTTDYFFRPYISGVHKLIDVKELHSLGICVGPESTTDRIMKYVVDFASVFSNNSYFAFVKLKNFSNTKNKRNCYSRIIDENMEEFFKRLQNTGVFQDTFIVFFSNNGNLEHSSREYQGWFEDKMPVLKILVPDRFKHSHPIKFKKFIKNVNELVSPYHIHVTLIDILTNSENKNSAAQSCSKCKSLFSSEFDSLSCADAGIQDKCCVRNQYIEMPIYDPIIERAGKYMTTYITNEISEHLSKCANISFQRVVKSKVLFMNEYGSYHGQDYYLVRVEVSPGETLFEVLLEHNRIASGMPNEFTLSGSINRISNLAASECINDSDLQHYCICPHNIS